MDRIESLRQIVTFGEFRENAFIDLVKLGVASEADCFELSHKILSDTLSLYISGTITADELEEWANFIECRDDIKCSTLEDYIYALANPEIMGNIDERKITKMLQVLSTSS